MAKFVIECPACHKAHQVGGLFGKKQIKCGCGYLIDVDNEKMAQEVCPHCGNTVVYDRAKKQDATCPTCHAKIYAAKPVSFSCPSCKTKLTADANAKTYICPSCKTTIDVQARLTQERNSQTAQIIQWDMGQNDIFVYRHPMENFKLGSQLIVQEYQKAVFFRNGQALDVFGPGRYTLQTQNMPLLEEVLQYPTDADLTFDSRVYFVRMNRLNVKWGAPSMKLRNPGMDFYVDVGASGSVDMQLLDGNENVRKLLASVLGTTGGGVSNAPRGADESYTATYMEDKFRDVVTSRLSALFADILIQNNINALDLETKKIVIGDILANEYNGILEEYGLCVPPKHFFLTKVIIHNSEEVQTWLRQESDRVLKVREEGVLKAEAEARQGRVLVEEQTEVQRSILRTQGEAEEMKITAQAHAAAVTFEAQGQAEATRLTGQASAEAYKAQAIAEAEEMRAKGYTYGEETSRQIGLEAMQNGLPGTGGNGGAASGIGSALGDMVGLGVGLSAMGGVVNMTKDVMNPIVNQMSEIGKPSTPTPPLSPLVSAWNCACGNTCITTKFCPDCGASKPMAATWDCARCGQRDIASNFCPNCGCKKGE